VAGLSRVGCVNIHTPPGYEGYVRSKPIAGAGKFVGIQRGPTSTGWVWRQEVVNIDMRPRTYSEQNSILTAEQLKLTFTAHGRIRLRPGTVKQVVEQFGGPNWYEANVRQQFSAAVREEVQSLKSFEVKDKVDEISAYVMKKMGEVYKDTPIEFLSVDIGDIQYPEVVVKSVIRKFVTNQENERKEIELKIAQKQIDIGIAEATGTRDAQRIIRTTLDPMYLQYEALEAIEELAGSPNTTFLVLPFSKSGQAPIIMSIDK
jgi:regulator of protease activity HflC (stomatin/prohibitin superfamily)